MKIMNKVTDWIAKIAIWIIVAMVCGMVLMILAELLYRDIFNNSFHATIEICGIMFLWMAFIGIIPLYNETGLMRLDFLLTHVKGIVAEIFYLISKGFSMLLGTVMVIAFIAQYPFVSTRFYATITWLPYTIQYVPVAIAGAFIVLKTIQQLIEHFMHYPSLPENSNAVEIKEEV